jgi:putative ABC transport system permease protein
VVFNGVWSTAGGIAIGIAGAYAMARLAASLLYGIAPSDPVTYAAFSALVFGITLLATWVPSRRAQRVNPVSVLRTE